MGGDEGGEVGEECSVGRTDVNGGDGAEVGVGRRIRGRAYAAERLEGTEGGVWSPDVIVDEMGRELGMEEGKDVLMDAVVGGEAIGGVVGIAEEGRREAKQEAVGLCWICVARFEEEESVGGPGVGNSETDGGRWESSGFECGDGEGTRAEEVHFLNDEADYGFGEIVGIGGMIVSLVGLDGNGEVEVSAGSSVGGGMGGFHMVGDTGGFEVAGKGARMTAVVEANGGNNNIAYVRFGKRRGRAIRGRDGDLGHEGHGKVVMKVVRKAEKWLGALAKRRLSGW